MAVRPITLVFLGAIHGFAGLLVVQARADNVADESLARLESQYESQVAPLLSKYCASCHGPKRHQGELNLMSYADAASVARDVKTWEKIAEYIDLAEMPPFDKPQPTVEEIETITGWVAGVPELGGVSRAGRSGTGDAASPEPGGVQQHDPRPRRCRFPAGGRLPDRRRRLRLRQHRRRADPLADLAGEISGRRGRDRRPRDRRPRHARPGQVLEPREFRGDGGRDGDAPQPVYQR